MRPSLLRTLLRGPAATLCAAALLLASAAATPVAPGPQEAAGAVSPPARTAGEDGGRVAGAETDGNGADVAARSAGSDEEVLAQGGKRRGRGRGGRRARAGGAPDLDERRKVSAREEERRLVGIERKVVAALIRFRPWLASDRGVHERIEGLGGFTGPHFGEWEQALERASLELVELHRAALPDPRRREAAWLEGWLHSERLLLATHPRHRNDPSYYVEGLHRSLAGLARSDAALLFQRMERTSLVLAHVPVACEAARNAIRRPVAAWLELGLPRVGALIEFLEVDVAERGRAVAWTPEERAVFDRRRERAVDAVRQLAKWMEDQKRSSRTTEVPPFQKGLWEKLVELRLGLVVDPAELRLATRSDIGRLQSERVAGALSELGHVPPMRPLAIERRLQDEAERLRGRAREAGWPEAPPLELAVSGYRAELPWEPFALLRSGPERWTLELGMPSKPWPLDARIARAELLQPWIQLALAARFGPTGEAGVRSRCARSTTLTRSWVPNPETAAGFGLYAAHVARTGGWWEREHEDSSYRDAVRRLQLLAAARLVLAIDLIVENEPMDEVVRTFADHTGCDPLTAQREALLTARDPLRGVEYLVFRGLHELEGADPERPPADVAAAVARTIADEPCARIGDLLAEVLR